MESNLYRHFKKSFFLRDSSVIVPVLYCARNQEKNK